MKKIIVGYLFYYNPKLKLNNFKLYPLYKIVDFIRIKETSELIKLIKKKPCFSYKGLPCYLIIDGLTETCTLFDYFPKMDNMINKALKIKSKVDKK